MNLSKIFFSTPIILSFTGASVQLQKTEALNEERTN